VRRSLKSGLLLTPFVDVRYDQMADLEMGMFVGFGHTPLPVGYRTQVMIERELKRQDQGN